MMRKLIPLATLPCPVRMTNSPMSASPHGLERHLFKRERMIEIAELRERLELEAWVDGWQLAEAA